MTDLLRSILQTAHNANTATNAPPTPAVKTERQPVDAIRVPPSACTAGVTADALLAVEEAQRSGAMKLETGSDASKAQRAARRDAVNARRETKRKSMSPSVESADIVAMTAVAAAASLATDAESPESSSSSGEKSKKMKTSKTTSVNVSIGSPMSSSADDADAKLTARKSDFYFGNGDIDALGEERLRAMEAQLESLDPDSKEAKKKRRLIRNRMSAQLHRERKKAYVGQLEDQLMEKERELKALQEKMHAIVIENSQMKQKLEVVAVEPTVVAAPVVAVAKPIVQIEDDVAIKTEPVVDAASAFDASLAAAAAALSKDHWEDCFPSLADAEMTDMGAAEDLLRDLDHPFAAYTAALMQQKPHDQLVAHHEIHAAKKNFVMMMGMMFSATVFGNAPHPVDVQKFSSFFDAHPKDVPQLPLASKLLSSLEKASWKDFGDIASWTTALDAKAVAADDDSDDEDEDDETKDEVVMQEADADDDDEEKAANASSAASSAAGVSPAPSDITDSSESCDSPVGQVDDCLGLTGFETDLIDEFEYPVDDPFAPTLADLKWFGDDDGAAVDFGAVATVDEESKELASPL